MCNPPPESASESAARVTRLGGRDQNGGGWHKIRPIMRCWLRSYHSSLHGTPQSVLHPKLWFLATSPNFADSLGPSPTRGGGGGCMCFESRAHQVISAPSTGKQQQGTLYQSFPSFLRTSTETPPPQCWPPPKQNPQIVPPVVWGALAWALCSPATHPCGHAPGPGHRIAFPPIAAYVRGN